MTRTLRNLIGWCLSAALLTACLPDDVQLPQNDFLAALEPKSGLIAFVGVDGNVYTVDQGGANPTALTTDAERTADGFLLYGLPTWSEDGETVAFAAYEGTGEALTRNRLMVAPKDGTSLTEAYSSPDYLVYYNWAPDGTRLSLLSQTPGALAFKLVNAQGGEPYLLDAGSPFYWAWAPDSRSVLIHANGENGRLAFLELGDDPAAVVQQNLPITPSAFKAPAFAPDGRQVLVAQTRPDGAPELVLAEADGSNPRTLVTYGQDIAFAWSPDGARIAYVDSEQLLGPLTVIDPAGQQAPITLAEQVYAFFWSPDSRSVAYFVVETVAAEGETPGGNVSRLKVLDVASGQSRVLTDLTPTDRFLQMVPFIDQYHHSVTIWSPDSQNLVISTYYNEDKSGVFILNASGNLEPRFLAEAEVGVWSWK